MSYTEVLKDIAETITVELVEEANPRRWTGYGLDAADLSPADRAQRELDKKAAMNTANLLAKIKAVVALDAPATGKGAGVQIGAGVSEEELKRYEAEAHEIMRRINANGMLN
ncbi:hypothetical protein [Herbiconiux daphne]|uniref:Uncharacterized protein n=1 Tax=Herbiconiux daphne TaxID=2970914 RepID=A0ABT2HBT5_9MICO|nr:hypothetical protein [Herbiconiux daphne]MCS5737425.1 hypothetical protein [Herbiconiux daphne]